MAFWRKKDEDVAAVLRKVGKREPFRWVRQLDDAELERLNAGALDRFKANGANVQMVSSADLRAFSEMALPAEKAFLESSGLGASAALAKKSVGRN